MTKPIILTDVDGVLVDWFSRLPYFLKKKGLPYERAVAMYAHGHWQTIEELTGLPTPEAEALVDEYARSKYMEFLSPYKDALIAVNNLKHHYDFVAVTAISESDECYERRKANLDFWFPNAFTGLHCVGSGGDKQATLAKYEPTIWIDDTPKHISEGLRAGHKCIRLVRDSRMDVTSSFIAHNWHEISNLILQMIPTR